MSCESCKFNRGINKNMVACGSMRHAKFMDIEGNTDHQRTVSIYGSMPLVSADALRMECPDVALKVGRYA